VGNGSNAAIRVLLAVLVVGGVLIGPTATASAASASKDASLTVKVTGLPAGVPAAVTVSGPSGFRAKLAHSHRFGHLSPGTYRARLAPVRVRRQAKGVPAGSQAFPAKRLVRVRLRPGGHATGNAAYGTIRSSSVAVLRAPALGFSGPAANPGSVLLPAGAAAAFGRGSIVAAAPSASLPHGLFHRVTSVSRKGGRVTLSLTPASLTEAFPGLDVSASVPLDPAAGAGAADGAGASSALSAIDLSFSKELIAKKLKGACGLPPSGWSFSPKASIHPSMKVDIHRHYLVVPYGELSLEVDGSLGVEATLPAGVHCDLLLNGPTLQGFVPVAGVPVPVEGGVDLAISIRNGEPIGVKANAGVKVAGGMSFDGPKTKPIAKFEPSGSGSVSGANGEVEVGPRLQAGIGVLAGNAHVEIDPRLAGAAKPSGCEILLRASIGAGLDLGSFHPTINSPNLEKAIYHCPAKDGGGSSGGGGSTGTWTAQSAPDLPGGLSGVSCPSASFCMAVGSREGGDSSLAMTWNGSGWTVVPPPDPSAQNRYLYDVSCTSASFCVAVGYASPSFPGEPLIERWDGSAWSVMPSPAISGGSLSGISCASPSWCMAAGRTDSGSMAPLLEHWDGGSWTVQAAPTPPGSDEQDFSSVACAGEGSCEAVGSYDNDQGILTGTAFADHWNGSGWTVETTPATGDAVFSGFAGVGCASPTFCAAVGYFDRGLGTHAFPLADAWNGGSWSNQPTQELPAGSVSGETVAVSCMGADACVTVGYLYDGSRTQALAERGNGSSWALEPTPELPGAEYATLEDVSCPTPGNCVAVGGYQQTFGERGRPLIETRSG
jgi:hypothetical protein